MVYTQYNGIINKHDTMVSLNGIINKHNTMVSLINTIQWYH